MSDNLSTPDKDAQKRRRRISSSTSDGLPTIVPGNSPPKFLTLEEFATASKQLENMALAHEVALSNDFKLPEPQSPPKNSVAAKVSEIAFQAFWSVLRDQLSQDPPDYSHAITLLEEIKDKILGLLLPQHTRIKKEIEEKLDTDLLKQQAENTPDAIDFRPYSNYILAVMGKLCAPLRDDKIKALQDETDIVALFKGIFETLDLMHLDMANFTISSIRPHIKEHSVEYEREKFQKYLDATHTTLTITEKWLHNAYTELQRDENEDFPPSSSGTEKGDSTTPSSVKSPRINVPLNKILNRAYMQLLEMHPPALLPETAALDAVRIGELQKSCTSVILTASAWAIITNVVGRNTIEFPKFRDDIPPKIVTLVASAKPDELSDAFGSLAELVIKIYTALSNTNNWNQLTNEQMEALRQQLSDLVSPDNRVRKVFRNRVFSFIENVFDNPSASPVKLPPGISVVQRQLASVTGTYLKLASYNRSVFGPYYDEILERVVATNTTCAAVAPPTLESPAAATNSPSHSSLTTDVDTLSTTTCEANTATTVKDNIITNHDVTETGSNNKVE